MSVQFLREASLLVTRTADALDLSNMHFTFLITANDNETPTIARIRVYNLSPQTEQNIKNQYTGIILQAGYRGGVKGTIFSGTIIQTRHGWDNPADQYVDIIGADGDIPYNFSKVKKTIAAGRPYQDQVDALVEAFAAKGANPEPNLDPAAFTGGILPRGKVLYGMAKTYARNLANNTATSWSIQNGRLTFSPLTSLLPTADQAVVLTAQSGLLGFPEQTENGIELTCLINPLIRVGGLVKLDNSLIQRGQTGVSWNTVNRFADIDKDGFYKVLVSEYNGDTRGDDWNQQLTCIAVNQSSTSGIKINPYL